MEKRNSRATYSKSPLCNETDCIQMSHTSGVTQKAVLEKLHQHELLVKWKSFILRLNLRYQSCQWQLNTGFDSKSRGMPSNRDSRQEYSGGHKHLLLLRKEERL